MLIDLNSVSSFWFVICCVYVRISEKCQLIVCICMSIVCDARDDGCVIKRTSLRNTKKSFQQRMIGVLCSLYSEMQVIVY